MEEEEQYAQADYMISDINARIRILESKNSLFNERLLIVNQNMIKEYKKTVQDLRDLQKEIKDLKQEMFKMKGALRHMTTELNFFARKEDLKVLEKYINMWDPLNIVTRKEVEDLIKKEGEK